MGVMSAWLVVMLLYQLCISFFGFKRNTKNYQDHDPQMRFLVLVPAHNEEAVIADIIDNLEHMEYPIYVGSSSAEEDLKKTNITL